MTELEKTIHNLLLSHWKKLLEAGGDIPASQIKEIRQYLADNDIGANPELNEDVNKILDEIPFDEGEGVIPIKRYR